MFQTFIATFRTQRIWSFPCFLTHLYSKELVISMFLDTFHNQKCLKTVKRQDPLNYSKNLVISPVSGHFPYSKVSRKSKTTKSLEVFKEFGQFSCFLTLYFGNGWKITRSEGWNIGRLECWKIVRLEG